LSLVWAVNKYLSNDKPMDLHTGAWAYIRVGLFGMAWASVNIVGLYMGVGLYSEVYAGIMYMVKM
jgi:hypothetical protein